MAILLVNQTRRMSSLKTFVDKCVSLSRLGRIWLDSLCAAFCESARTISYVETVSNKADTLHKSLSCVDEHWIKRSYELELRKAIKRLGLSRVELAIDTTKDPYFGEEKFYTRGSKYERGTDTAWEFVQLSIVWPIRVPLMALPYHMGADLVLLVIELLEYARSLPLSIVKVLFDRGFYNWQLIDYLESARQKRPVPYLIFVPQNEKVKRHIDQTEGKIGYYNYEGSHNMKKSTWKTKTTLVVCKDAGRNKKGEPYDMVFATNLRPSYSLIRQYKRRWNIETGFRVQNEGKIKTKSNNPIIRFFYFLLRCLFSLLWIVSNAIKTELDYKSYLRAIEKDLTKNEVYRPPNIIPAY